MFIISSVVRLYQCLAALKLLTQGLVFHCMTDKTLNNNILQIINLLGIVYIYIQKALQTEVWFSCMTNLCYLLLTSGKCVPCFNTSVSKWNVTSLGSLHH